MKGVIIILDKNYARVRDGIFFLICFCVIFDNMPKVLQFKYLGGPLGGQLGVYAIFLGFIFTGYLAYKEKIVWKNRTVIIFFAVAIISSLASTIYGLIIYPYYDLIFNAPVTQIEKLPMIISVLQDHHLYLSSNSLLITLIIIRSIKAAFLNLLYTFGLSYMIYIWYRGQFKEAWTVLKKGVLFGLLIFIAYGFIDATFQMGIQSARDILEKINPILHPIAVEHDWWPPLLWKGQLRSVLCEPSRVGNYISFVLPLLFIPIFNRSHYWKLYMLMSGCLIYMIFLTKARTSVAMLFGILFLVMFSLLWLKSKVYLKQFANIIFITIVAFSLSIFSISSNKMIGQDSFEYQEEVQNYLQDNVGSLATKNERSNQARYALIKSNIRTGIEHPILGVGSQLNGAYTVAHFDTFDMQSQEVKKWVSDFYDQGPIKINFDSMNAYVTCFSTTGILGLICLLTPFVYVLIHLRKKISICLDQKKKIRLLGLFIALISSMVAGCNGSLTVLYAVWILLSLAYIAIAETDNETIYL